MVVLFSEIDHVCMTTGDSEDAFFQIRYKKEKKCALEDKNKYKTKMVRTFSI